MKILWLNRNHNHTPLPICPSITSNQLKILKQAKGQKQTYIPIWANHYIQTTFLIHRSLWMINQDKPGECGPTIGITKILKTGSSKNVYKLLH